MYRDKYGVRYICTTGDFDFMLGEKMCLVNVLPNFCLTSQLH